MPFRGEILWKKLALPLPRFWLGARQLSLTCNEGDASVFFPCDERIFSSFVTLWPQVMRVFGMKETVHLQDLVLGMAVTRFQSAGLTSFWPQNIPRCMVVVYHHWSRESSGSLCNLNANDSSYKMPWIQMRFMTTRFPDELRYQHHLRGNTCTWRDSGPHTTSHQWSFFLNLYAQSNLFSRGTTAQLLKRHQGKSWLQAFRACFHRPWPAGRTRERCSSEPAAKWYIALNNATPTPGNWSNFWNESSVNKSVFTSFIAGPESLCQKTQLLLMSRVFVACSRKSFRE